MNIELLEIEYPEPVTRKIYMSKLMKEASSRTMSIHKAGAMGVYTGEAGVGKTTTAREICRSLEAKFKSENPKAFLGLHLQFGRIDQGNGAKRALRSVYAASGLLLDEYDYDRLPSEELAAELVEHFRTHRIQVLFADEAGLISPEAIGGLVTLHDVAQYNGWPLTIIFIGMDDLAIKLRRRPQVNRRLKEWIYFKHYNLEDTISLLRVMHPYFDGLDETAKEGRTQFEFIHKITHGLPGNMIPFIDRFDYRYQKRKDGKDITVGFLEGIHFVTQESIKQSVNLSRHVYSDGERNEKSIEKKQSKKEKQKV